MISKEELMLQQEDINNHQEIELANSLAKIYPVLRHRNSFVLHWWELPRIVFPTDNFQGHDFLNYKKI